MDNYPINRSIQILKERYVEGFGFVNKTGGGYRPDAACWAIVALRAALGEDQLIEKARKQLASIQAADGRVCISPEHPDAYWPTSLAILAWQASADYKKEQSRAVNFLLNFSEIQNSALPDANSSLSCSMVALLTRPLGFGNPEGLGCHRQVMGRLCNR